MRDLNISYVSPDALTPYAHNARIHAKKHIRQIADSIRIFGWTNPVLVDGDGGVIAGHGRVLAARELGLEKVPTIALADLSPAQKRAYILADNKLAENAGWDRDILSLELKALIELDLDFELEVTGFETAEIDILIDGAGGDTNDPRDEIPDINPDTPAVSRLGDLWRLGTHRILCADATAADSYERLMAGQKAQMVFGDPPYNVPVDGHVCGLGSIKHREFAMASGEMDESAFIAFLGTVCGHMADHSVDGAIHFLCMDWRHAFELLSAGRGVYAELKNLCVWNKTNGGMGSLYRSKHELVFVFKKGTAAHINNVELGRHGRNRTNVWDYAGVNSLKAERLDELAMHPTVKPVALVADAIRDCSKRNGLILDPFSGSGTTLIAAEHTGRVARVMEIDPNYVDVAIKRWQALTGEPASHDDTGLGFAELAETRAPDVDDQVREMAHG